jgi:hypothetical protein
MERLETGNVMGHEGIGLGLLILLGQVINYILHLRIRTAILESEGKVLKQVDELYVRKETCRVAMGQVKQET